MQAVPGQQADRAACHCRAGGRGDHTEIPGERDVHQRFTPERGAAGKDHADRGDDNLCAGIHFFFDHPRAGVAVFGCRVQPSDFRHQ